MATKGKKISQASVADTIDGNELLPFAKSGDNGAVYIKTVLKKTVASENTQEVESLEKTLSTNEQQRISNEYSRQSSEQQRATNEQTRQSQETARQTSEQTRTANETARGTAEQTRQAKETERQTAETARQTAESARVSAEAQRAQEFAGFEDEIELAKVKVFCDLFSTAAGDDGYARVTNSQFDCKLNGLTLTYAEAVLIYNVTNGAYATEQCQGSRIRTNLYNPRTSYLGGAKNDHCPSNVFNGCSLIEVIRLHNFTWVDDWHKMFRDCPKLVKILGAIGFGVNSLNPIIAEIFHGCPKLESFKLHALKSTIDLSGNPLIDLASFQYMITDAANGTKTITITVHPDVYAKLTDTTNTQWYAVLEAALAKNISFATV